MSLLLLFLNAVGLGTPIEETEVDASFGLSTEVEASAAFSTTVTATFGSVTTVVATAKG